MPGTAEVPAVHHQGGAVVGRLAHNPDHPFLGRGGDQRAHLGIRIRTLGHLDGAGAVLDLPHQRVGGVPDGDRHRDGHAALSGGAEGGGGKMVRGVVQVRVRQDDRVVLRPAQGLHALAVRGGRLVDVLGDRGGADKGDGVHRPGG